MSERSRDAARYLAAYGLDTAEVAFCADCDRLGRDAKRPRP